MTLDERLRGPHEWGYRDPVEGGFIEDNTPFRAADRIEALEEAMREIEALAGQRKGAPYSNVLWNMGDVEAIARAALNPSEPTVPQQKPVPPPAS